MIDVHEEEFNRETGILNSMITIYCRSKEDVNKYILDYINEKDYTLFDYVYNKSLGSTIDVQAKDNKNGSYLIKLTIKYVKLLIDVKFVSKDNW